MSLSYFPDTQTLTMQQEALKRVRDMQARARQSVEQANAFSDMPASQGAWAYSPDSTAQPAFQQQGQNPPPFRARQQQFPQNGAQQSPQAYFTPQNTSSQNSAQQDWQNPQQGDARAYDSAQRRPPSSERPNNILSHLFGGGRQQPAQGQGSPRQTGGFGLLDMLRKQGLGDSLGGLGSTLQNTISSVSEPISGLLDSFGIDGEKLVILLVMWAIFNEQKDDKMLLMALGYLLL